MFPNRQEKNETRSHSLIVNNIFVLPRHWRFKELLARGRSVTSRTEGLFWGCLLPWLYLLPRGPSSLFAMRGCIEGIYRHGGTYCLVDHHLCLQWEDVLREFIAAAVLICSWTLSELSQWEGPCHIFTSHLRRALRIISRVAQSVWKQTRDNSIIFSISKITDHKRSLTCTGKKSVF